MAKNDLDRFREYRERMNEIILEKGNTQTKRFFALDSRVYEDGVLDRRMKELLGLVASAVLRCDDCITYHVIQCVDQGITEEQFFEAMNVALVVGGSIVIPHYRRAVETFEKSNKMKSSSK